MHTPGAPKIYHIVHVDRLPSIIDDGCLWCDAVMARRHGAGTMIGIPEIKARRLQSPLSSHTGLHVGGCVPFYFCPRSIMLYVISKGNHSALSYRGGQDPIVHLEADMRAVVKWADKNHRRWAFTSSNAGSHHFEDWCDLGQLGKIDWKAVGSQFWPGCRDEKQAEFLVEKSLSWKLIERIGVHSKPIGSQVKAILRETSHRPNVEVKTDWYY